MRNFGNPPPADRLSPFAALALRAALLDELAAQRFFHAVIAAFGPVDPWPSLAHSNALRLRILTALAQRHRLVLPPLPPDTTQIMPGWRINLERGQLGCVSSVSLYQQLIASVPDAALRNVFQRFQTELLTRQLPALQRAWQAAADRERYHAMQGVDADQAYHSHGLIGDTVEQLLALLTRQGGIFGLAGTLLRAAHPALVAGAFTGSAAVQGVRLRRQLASRSTTYSQED